MVIDKKLAENTAHTVINLGLDYLNADMPYEACKMLALYDTIALSYKIKFTKEELELSDGCKPYLLGHLSMYESKK
jgi:hypothetical protein